MTYLSVRWGQLRGATAMGLSLALAGCTEPTPVSHDCTSLAALSSGEALRFERVFSEVDIPEGIALRQAPGGERWYLATQRGEIHTFANQSDARPELFADLKDAVVFDGEAGLLGIAFHPDYAQNGQLFVSYNAPGPGAFSTRVSRFVVDDPLRLDLDSESVIFELSQPYTNHNGGDLHFGPDGYLYLGLGDGGSAEDPQGHGQNTDTLLGSMLRFDVDGGPPYVIPPDNPFAAGGGAPEIFAWGLRNPWRFSFDRETGELWAGDVGQYEWEEVDLIRRGQNYGWNIKEGDACFGQDPCELPGLADPVAVYANEDGASVVGGYVYRGQEIPQLEGSYIYTDFYFGTLWAVVEGQSPRVLMERTGRTIGAFAEDRQGELYGIDYGGGIYRLRVNEAAGGASLPTRLRDTGCVDAEDPTRPDSQALRYDLAVPFWSDGAQKERWLRLPEGEAVSVSEDGDFDLPPGSVVTKYFHFEGRPIETRLLVHHLDGRWAGYSYAWNEAGTEASLLEGGETRDFDGRSWSYPSRGECMACHTSAAGFSLGLEAAQLAGVDEGAQFDGWISRGWLAARPDTPALPAIDGDAPLASRARAYLHANCSHCHREGGRSNTSPDFHWATPETELGVCDQSPVGTDLGVAGASLLSPGDAASSLIPLRMRELGDARMPPVGSRVVDEEGAALIEAWIDGLAACP